MIFYLEKWKGVPSTVELTSDADCLSSDIELMLNWIETFQVYFLYLNTDLAFRDRSLRDMLKVYHDTFATYFPPDAAYLPEKVSQGRLHKPSLSTILLTETLSFLGAGSHL